MQRLILVMTSLSAAACVNLTPPPQLSQPGNQPEGDAGGAALDAPPGVTAGDAAARGDAPGSGPRQEGADSAPAAERAAFTPDPLAAADAALLGTGARCDQPGQCGSGQCESGVCCDSPCSRRCYSCTLTGSVGHCLPIPAGEQSAGQCQPEAVAGCGRDGTCDGQGECRRYPAGTECVPGTCTASTESAARTCDGAGVCRPAATRSCAPNVCMGGSCATRCTGQSQCQTGFFCDGTACRSKRRTGDACRMPFECGSGNCVDGTCCSSPCGQSCFACNVEGSAGTCVAVPTGKDPRGDCAAQPVLTCEGDGFCDGAGACRRYAAGTECVPASCRDGTALSPRACSSLGSCGPSSAVDCGPFACAGSACASTCTTDAQCRTGAACTGGACAFSGLVLHWKFDEPGGTVAEDASGNGLDGTYTGAMGLPTPSPVVPPPIKFVDAGSRNFASAQRQGVDLAAMPALLKPTAELTLSAWYRATTTDADGNGSEIISGGNNYLLRLRPGDIEADKRAMSAGGNKHIRCFAVVPNHLDGNWHHLASVIDAAALKVYFDGAEVCSLANTDPMVADLGNAFRVGRHGEAETKFDFDGSIDDVRVYSRALSAAEIAALAMGGR